MRKALLSLSIALAGCTTSEEPRDAGSDGGSVDASRDAEPDASRDADLDASRDADLDADLDANRDADLDADLDAATDAPTCPTTLLAGGIDVATQGWTTVMRTPASITYGADYVELTTSTPTGARMSGQLLLSYADAVTPGMPFSLEVVALVSSASPHEPFDVGAAILGSFTAPFGVETDRAQMIYLDPTALGWADDTQSFAAATIDGAYHTYVLSVDATGLATLTRDGVLALMRTGYTTNGTIAVGDQTNDPGIDGTMRIRSVTLLCP